MGFFGFRVPAQGNRVALGVLYPGIAAVDLQCRPDAGEDQVRAPDTLPLQPLHPVPHPPGKFAEDLIPVPDGCVLWTRPADEVDAGGERGRFL